MDQNELIKYLRTQGIINTNAVEITPLNGGVSCEILLIEDGLQRLVVKRALKKLKVKEDWFADIGRNVTEQEYLKYVGSLLPDAVPKIIYQDKEHHFFCMEMIEGDFENWKKELLAGTCNNAYAREAGHILGIIHNTSFDNEALAKQFDTTQNFFELRLDPYLLSTAKKHPKIAHYFNEEALRLNKTHKCLVHGDFSPKNIMVSPHRLVVLDCEVAWYGDPVFDLAFLINHFTLKGLLMPEKSHQLMHLATQFFTAYKEKATSFPVDHLERQSIHLLLLLMLARVDGKSPVEYLNTDQQEIIRSFVYETLPKEIKKLDEFISLWNKTTQLKYEY
ncbi:phosphotransferase [Flammeovirga yaeyamensis]|uniref:Phosphotransferase n=1 Tax=Flammeovirga yaeyamensis TaxID=367791 RepID=A0AAX1N5I2_9BACT|nr:aminoglycoside phosphotransferase family protein [Flammeovirga yaeyamensis]MBB3697392.1 aminoglycoside phosphotransferase (APT) family kinase protein [Flammeovirga yaeyamensis]NMF36086.1 phosphotransferase [Flammeovirga yaeyamensis]QWG02819.1 phosphotransferase [Flammeovirga yaeyamensis]